MFELTDVEEEASSESSTLFDKKKVTLKKLIYKKSAYNTFVSAFLYEQNLLLNYILADLTVLIILPAILYGSPLEAGLLSSSQPFQPFSTVIIGIRIEAPRSDTP